MQVQAVVEHPLAPFISIIINLTLRAIFNQLFLLQDGVRDMLIFDGHALPALRVLKLHESLVKLNTRNDQELVYCKAQDLPNGEDKCFGLVMIFENSFVVALEDFHEVVNLQAFKDNPDECQDDVHGKSESILSQLFALLSRSITSNFHKVYHC